MFTNLKYNIEGTLDWFDRGDGRSILNMSDSNLVTAENKQPFIKQDENLKITLPKSWIQSCRKVRNI